MAAVGHAQAGPAARAAWGKKMKRHASQAKKWKLALVAVAVAKGA